MIFYEELIVTILSGLARVRYLPYSKFGFSEFWSIDLKHLKDLNWNHLYYFYEAARLHSVKKVAAHIKSSPSNVSEQIKKLEQSLGTQLFKRTKGGLMVTPEGQTLYEHASVIFDEGYRVIEKFSKGDFGGYAVNAGLDAAIYPPLSSSFIQQYWDEYAQYGVVNTIEQADHDVLIENIVNESLDWGLSLTPSKRKSLTSVIIDNYEMSFCCAKFIFEKFKLKKDIVYYMPYIEIASEHPFKKKISAFFRSSGVGLNEVCHTDDYHFMMQQIRNGRAISILPNSIIHKDSELKAFQFEEKFSFPIYAIWKNSNESLLSVTKLKELAGSKLKKQKSSRYLQLKANAVPKEVLK